MKEHHARPFELKQIRNRDLRRLARDALAEGWSIEMIGGCHFKWTHPEGGFLFTGGSVSDRRAIRNIKSQMRAEGFRREQR
jgi:hypothetical protein